MDIQASIKNRAVRLFPLIASVIGYTLGIVLFITPDRKESFDLFSADMSSAFDAENSLGAFLTVYLNEAKYLLLIFLCGFCFLTLATSSLVLLVRGIGTGFSAIALWSGGCEVKTYLIHTVTSALFLILCALMCLRSIFFAEKRANGNVGMRLCAFGYFLEFLFINGLLLVFLFIRQLMLSL